MLRRSDQRIHTASALDHQHVLGSSAVGFRKDLAKEHTPNPQERVGVQTQQAKALRFCRQSCASKGGWAAVVIPVPGQNSEATFFPREFKSDQNRRKPTKIALPVRSCLLLCRTILRSHRQQQTSYRHLILWGGGGGTLDGAEGLLSSCQPEKLLEVPEFVGFLLDQGLAPLCQVTGGRHFLAETTFPRRGGYSNRSHRGHDGGLSNRLLTMV